ncbi:MAG TPA: DUF4412 domain-containing protein, partial [Polyangiaceae bacterium]
MVKARSLAFAFALPLALLAACKKEAPPAPASDAAAVSAAPAAATPASTGGDGLAILKDFEGKISWAAKGKIAGPSKDGGALNLALLVKGKKFRLELPPGLAGAQGAGGYLLGWPEDKKFYVVNDGQKQVLLIDSDKLGAQVEALSGKGAGPGTGADAPELKKTGKVEKVAGYNCEVWQIAHKTSRMEACIAAEGTDWLKLPVSKLPQQYTWASELSDGKHFPLRFVMFDKTGAEEGRVELTAIEKQPVDAARLELPPGYKVIDLEQMLGGLMQGLSGT